MVPPERSESDYIVELPEIPARRWVDDRHEQPSNPEDGPAELVRTRERTTATVVDCMREGSRPTLVEVLPGGGKSYGVIKAAAETNSRLLYLTSRGRKERYGKTQEWCDGFGLSHQVLPSFVEDCPTARGDHGDEWQNGVMNLYHGNGALGGKIHEKSHRLFGEELPCQETDSCPYTERWAALDDSVDVLIGHYHHAHLGSRITRNRIVVIDEFPDEYEQEFAEATLRRAINAYLDAPIEIPFGDFTDLMEGRKDKDRQRRALDWFGSSPDLRPMDELALTGGHRIAPLMTYALLACGDPENDLGNGFERCQLPDTQSGAKRYAVYDRGTGSLYITNPPPLNHARNVLALDGTPEPLMWEIALGMDLRHIEVLDSDEAKQAYIREGLGLTFVPTTDKANHCSGGNINLEQDSAILRAIRERHPDKEIAFISSKKAIAKLKRHEERPLSAVDRRGHYGNLKGSNEFKHVPVGVINGAPHYGDEHVKRWAAYLGIAVEPNRNHDTQTGFSMDLSYGPVGDRFFRQMRESEVVQAALRFGRGGAPAVVYLNTAAYPDWLPVVEGMATVRRVSESEQAVYAVVKALLDESGQLISKEVIQHPDVAVKEKQVRRYLNRFVDEGLLTYETERGRRVYRLAKPESSARGYPVSPSLAENVSEGERAVGD